MHCKRRWHIDGRPFNQRLEFPSCPMRPCEEHAIAFSTLFALPDFCISPHHFLSFHKRKEIKNGSISRKSKKKEREKKRTHTRAQHTSIFISSAIQLFDPRGNNNFSALVPHSLPCLLQYLFGSYQWRTSSSRQWIMRAHCSSPSLRQSVNWSYLFETNKIAFEERILVDW